MKTIVGRYLDRKDETVYPLQQYVQKAIEDMQMQENPKSDHRQISATFKQILNQPILNCLFRTRNREIETNFM